MKRLLKLVLLLLIVSCSSADDSTLKSGDIIFQTLLSEQSIAIHLATNSQYSHVGIIFVENGNINVYEAVQPVKITPLDEWISRGKDSSYVVKRLKKADKLLTNETLETMKGIGSSLIGKDYDLLFNWSDEEWYCSELVWKVYQRGAGIVLADLKKLGDFNLENELVRKILIERYGGDIPIDETVISPNDIFVSDQLEMIKNTY